MPDFEPSTWRLIVSPPDHGAWNMALDEAILESTAAGNSLPTLRLYAWQPACLSLGYAQPLSDVDIDALEQHGWELVRRPTGGRAILHIDELTYSVTGPQDEPRLAGSVLESYHRLSTALLEALLRLGIAAQALPNTAQPSTAVPAAAPLNPVCFEVPSNYEITFQGKKLIGSAQARRRGGVLQHGSLPLLGDLRRITQVLAFPDEAARRQAADRLLARAATAQDALGEPLPWPRAAQAMQEAFQSALNLVLVTGQPTPNELRRAGQLFNEKYCLPAWNKKT
ncbi:MAG: lipoate--protein ligase family protein [Anaerolineales bacterium]|nr:lipoate--protein ligase family protein [Anaerolineales bacterium]